MRIKNIFNFCRQVDNNGGVLQQFATKKTAKYRKACTPHLGTSANKMNKSANSRYISPPQPSRHTTNCNASTNKYSIAKPNGSINGNTIYACLKVLRRYILRKRNNLEHVGYVTAEIIPQLIDYKKMKGHRQMVTIPQYDANMTHSYRKYRNNKVTLTQGTTATTTSMTTNKFNVILHNNECEERIFTHDHFETYFWTGDFAMLSLIMTIIHVMELHTDAISVVTDGYDSDRSLHVLMTVLADICSHSEKSSDKM